MGRREPTRGGVRAPLEAIATITGVAGEGGFFLALVSADL